MMMPRCFLIMIAISIFASTTSASGIQNIEQLRKHVKEFTENYYKNVYGEEKLKNDVEVIVGTLDTRLKLSACDDYLTLKVIEAPHNAHNITVKTNCESEQRWAMYIPVTINIYEDVLVATHSIERGGTITDDDVTYKRVNVASNSRGLVNDFKSIEGYQLKRPLRAGENLQYSYLKKPDIVLKGQTVVLSSQSRFLSVEATGVALVNGHLGQEIKVKNEKSNRIVSAKVIAPGRVAVAIR